MTSNHLSMIIHVALFCYCTTRTVWDARGREPRTRLCMTHLGPLHLSDSYDVQTHAVSDKVFLELNLLYY